MNKLKSQLLILAMLVGVSACGGKSGGDSSGHKANDKTNNQVVTEVKDCNPTDVITVCSEYHVKLSRNIVEAVLDDMHRNQNFDAATFWQDLNQEVRGKLNFELNLLLDKEVPNDSEGVYKSLALFFSRIRTSFQEDVQYKIRDTKQNMYSFSVRAQHTNRVEYIALNCDTISNDLDFIQVPEVVLRASQIKEIYHCRTSDLALTLMEVSDQAILEYNEVLYSSPLTSLKKIDNTDSNNVFNKSLNLILKHETVDVNIFIRTNVDNDYGTWHGKRSRLKVGLPFVKFNRVGGCINLKHAF